MNWFGENILQPRPKKTRKKPIKKANKITPGGEASISGNEGEAEIDNIINNLKLRGADVDCYKPASNKALVSVDGVQLNPDRAIRGVPLGFSGTSEFYVERKKQGSSGSADHKFFRDFYNIVNGNYHLPVAWVYTFEPTPFTSKGKTRSEKSKHAMLKRWNSMVKTLDKWANEHNDNGYYLGAFTLEEFKHLVTRKVFPY